MSRVGKKPISIPNSIQVSVEGSKIVFKGGKLTKELETYGRVGIALKDGELTFALNGENAQAKAYWGTYRALANNIVVGSGGLNSLISAAICPICCLSAPLMVTRFLSTEISIPSGIS